MVVRSKECKTTGTRPGVIMPSIRFYCVADAALSALHISSPFIPAINLRGQQHCPHFTDVETVLDTERSVYQGTTAIKKVVHYSEFPRDGGMPCHAGPHGEAPGLVRHAF